MKNFKPKFVALLAALVVSSAAAFAQSGATRPRRVTPTQPTPAPAGTDGATATTRTRSTDLPPLGDTTRAYALLNQKQYEAALGEARAAAERDPKNTEAWKIAGFAAYNLKQYAEAAKDLERALELQRAASEEDENTVDALARSYVFTEQFDKALPLLVATTSRKGKAPDASALYYRGLAEYRTNKTADAERSFNAAVKVDPKLTGALFYLGRIAFDRKDDAAAISALNRATLADPRLAEAWSYLTYAYMRRADAAQGAAANADYLSAVKASEGLLRARGNDDAATMLHAQALIRASQFVRAATALERLAAKPDAPGQTLYLLGLAHSRAKNLPKAVAALERAAAQSPDDANIYRELGYALEASKQYAKALAAYEKGLSLAPDDAYFKESAERVRPFAK
ncbi:MAG TPA: tetratricopeptide repeat protein [Pyrinomonadaceae bacterium]|nr:tetratricopeptide repeat protein [Pyrinomonadaceae bacterium]